MIIIRTKKPFGKTVGHYYIVASLIIMKTKVLILGGSHFIGRNLVESLMANDEFHLELFNRGKTNHGLFPGLEVNIGDRNDNPSPCFPEHG